MRLLTILLILLSSCTDDNTEASSYCGAVVDEKLRNPVSEDRGKPVTIIGISEPNLISIIDDEGRADLIQLQAITPIPEKSRAAITFLNSLGTGAYLYLADGDDQDNRCEVRVEDDLVARPGQLFSNDSGLSFSEELLINQLVNVDDRTNCDGDLIVSCFSSLQLLD